ncbi:MAG TPA: transcriptional regulator [Ktedonobacteraceae bacterium]|nr:transcriptional regulator [Ktedonobacteraceae bacterium]
MAELNEVIHQPARLRLMSVLVSLGKENQASFNYLKDMLGLTDGNLGAHLRKLEEAGYVEICKTFVNNKPITYIEATALGRRAFSEHVAALEDILKVDKQQTNHNSNHDIH